MTATLSDCHQAKNARATRDADDRFGELQEAGRKG